MSFTPRSNHPVATRTLKIVIGFFVLSWSILPIYWGLVVSLSTQASINQVPPPIIPSALTLEHYAQILDLGSDSGSQFYLALTNSALQAGGSTLLTLAVALPAAYAFARLTFRGSAVLLTILITTLAMPVYLVMIPLFRVASSTGQTNTPQVAVLILTSAAIPLAIWILRSHISGLPEELEAAARLDGASTTTVLLRIVGPLIAPGVVAAAVVIFLSAWGAFLIPAVFTSSDLSQPLTVLIPKFASKFAQNLGIQAAAGVLAIIPPALLVIFLQRHLLSGLLKGASR